ncbi:MAG: SUMF1/EgtB/PvdO family nonheme iron enzyme [Geminicoccaceae bacterium]
MLRSCKLLWIGLLTLLWAGGAVAEPEKRVALVIGIANYVQAPELVTPVKDAQDIAERLRALGFDVMLGVDLGNREMVSTLREFGIRASTADVAVIYYAGHGVQVDGVNYLVPADAHLERVRDLLYEAVPLPLFMGELGGAKSLGIMILDACRDNPFVDRLSQSLGASQASQIGRGLGRIDDTPSDTFVAMSTRANAVAEDGEADHSPFAAALITELGTPGLELGLFFRRVRDRVLAATHGRQEPFTFGSVGAMPFYFNPKPPNRPPVLAATPPLEVLDDAGATALGIAAPTDPDGDSLVVQITQLPRGGNVLVSGRPVLIGEYLTAEQLRSAAFDPDGSLEGEAGTFQFLVDDRQGGQTRGAVAVLITASNRPPEIAPLQSARAVVNRIVVAPPRDADGDRLMVRVRKVPEAGKVRLGGRPLAPGDLVEPEQLDQLTYDVENAPVGSQQELGLVVEDGRGGEAQAVVRIAVAEAGAAAAAAIEAPAPLAAPAPAPAAQDVPLEPMTGTFVAISDANLRAKPEGTAPRVGRITKGTKLTALGRATGSKWVLVAPPGGDPAFVYADLLAEPGKEAAAAPPEAPPTAAAAPAPAAPAAAAATSAGAPTAAAATTTAAAERKAPLTRSSSGFVDCEQCPELIRINPGSFTMGLDGGDPSRQPAHKVAIDKPFALGRYEVTNAQWHACELAKACTPTRMTDPADDTPVYNVHWQDAMAYIAWLSKTTGKRYRLPSEAEWEYAARGGTTTRYWWGDKIEAGKVICRQCGGSGFDRLRPPPVASQPPNPWALVGMSGGVAEWVADCWFHNYADAPRNGSARDAPNCHKRVLRGGAWRDDPPDLEVTSRNSYDIDVRYLANGFRVARDID